MAKTEPTTTEPTTPDTEAAPSLPTLATVPLDAVPTAAASVSTAERAYVDGLTATLVAGNAVRADGFKTHDAANASAARIKRLVRKVYPDGAPVGDGKVVRFTVTGADDAFAWYAKAGTPSKAGRKAADAATTDAAAT